VIDRKYGLKRKVVFTNGCFDILHAGHIRFLQSAKDCGDTLVIGLNSDKSIKKIKGQDRPIICQEQRVEVLLGLKSVDYVVLFDEVDPLKLIETIKPDVLVKGKDWESGTIIGEEFVESYGGEVIRIPFEIDISTSSIIKKILRIIESKGK
jgi:D-beta-D-heptose 7-phosphate kinase/D-beta-D-heptose 1-phosphate adenosyltransferase